jgi:predicted phosphodiesterase
MKRREFLSATIGASLILPIASTLLAATTNKKKISVGIMTDLHQDVMHDGPIRLQAFLNEMKRNRPDAIMQMGDFAYPNEKNRDLIESFNNAHQNRLHVIGNHDTDAGHKKEEVISFWGMPNRYYSKEINGIWFIILDGNDKGSPKHKGGYPAFIGEEQTNWLKQQLIEIKGPIIVVSHQPLAGPMSVDNAEDIQKILSSASDKILVAINGHTHIDSLLDINGIRYVTINSASYFWVGSEFRHEMYSKEIHAAHPYIASTCPYSEPLFTVLTIDFKGGTIKIDGKKGDWVGKSPTELGYTDKTTIKVGAEIVPFIRSVKLKTTKRQMA